jgi:SAM-dependent methyltransferase
VIVDHYAGAAQRWAHGATLVYGPIARRLVETSPHPLIGRVVLDVGAGTGVASESLAALGAPTIAADLSLDMLAWDSTKRPPAVVADVCALPFGDRSVDDTVAAFVLNHLTDPAAGFAELIRVTRHRGALLACVYANASRSEVRDRVDRLAAQAGWQIPEWYLEVKQRATPLLGTGEDMERAAKQAGLDDIVVTERPVDVGVTEPQQLVDYRLGQAHFAAWLDQLGPDRADEVRAGIMGAIGPTIRPYQPIVVFLSALVP